MARRSVNMIAAASVAVLLAMPWVAQAQGLGNSPGFCPPGLAKKNNGCLPPGQAKKYQLGHPLPPGIDYQYVYDLNEYDLPPIDGDWLYVLLGNEILRVADQDSTVLDVVRVLALADAVSQ